MDFEEFSKIFPVQSLNALLYPGSEVIGESIGEIFKGISHVSLDWLRRYNIVQQQKIDDFIDLASKKLDDIPVENRDNSKFGSVLKTIDDSKYQLDEDDMRKYFSNLIAATLDNRKNEQVKPIFSEILKNLSTEDANFLKLIYESDRFLPASYIYKSKENEFIINNDLSDTGLSKRWTRNSNTYLLLEDYYLNNRNFEINVLEQLNLIQKIDKPASYPYSQRYIQFEKYIKDTFPVLMPGYEYRTENFIYHLTNLGVLFCQIVID